MADEDINKEKRSRSQRKAAITRLVNTIKRNIADEEVDTVEEKLKTLKETFIRFEEQHNVYHGLLEDDGEIEASDNYFMKTETEYAEAVTEFRKWLKTVKNEKDGATVDVKTMGIENTVISRDLMTILNLPKVELEIFDGNPVKYHSFIAIFDESVDKVVSDNRTKLLRLLQYTKGKALDAIRSCSMLSADEGYEQAKGILKKRFGNDHLVTEKLIESIRNGKRVKSAEDLQELSDELSTCFKTLRQMDKLKEIDSQNFILQVINRLQPYLQTRWKRLALENKRNTDCYPGFESLVKFVENEAEEANDPVYGTVTSSDRSDKRKFQHSEKFSKMQHSFTASLNQQPNATRRYHCVLCGNDHKLFGCENFKKLKPFERLKIVNDHKLCHNCLLGNHVTEDCRKETVCSVPGCGKKHTKFIHLPVNETVNSLQLCHANSIGTGLDVHLPIVDVKVNGTFDTCALLDTASSGTFCTRSLVNAMHLVGRQVSYQLSTINSCESNMSSKVVKLEISDKDGKSVMTLNNVIVVDKIPVKCKMFQHQTSYSHLRDLSFATCNNYVDILIGQDNAELLVPLETRVGKKGEPFACRTVLGWTLNGPVQTLSRVSQAIVSHFICSETIESKIEKLWDVENEGLVKDGQSLSVEDRKVIDLWDKELKLVDGHLEIPIPRKECAQFPNNLSVAQCRLKSLDCSLKKRNLKSRYNEEVVKLLSNGYAETVPIYDVHRSSDVWYLPHQAVITERKPDKVRLVFDCASQFHGESLNDKCYQGPNLNSKLLNVLLRFRQHSYAIQADIEAMYNQVLIPVSDRDLLRFLWFDENGELVHHRMTRHLFGGIWCASSSAYALQHTLDYAVDVDPLVDSTIRSAFYVDDCLKSVMTKGETFRVINHTRDVLGKCGFNLTKFIVNDAEILSQIPVELRAKEVKELNSNMKSQVLGGKWNVNEDVFYFSLKLDDKTPVTRRVMLSTVASIFDPLGLIAPFVVGGKLLFQDVTKLKIPWDEEIPLEINNKWMSWVDCLNFLVDCKFRRCIKPARFDDGVHEIHHFSDASERALGCCSYLRCTNKDGEIYTTLIMSKGKIAPLKSLSIPRLELQAAVMAARIDDLLRTELEIDLMPSFFWVDSELVLRYILNESRRFNIYVSNRVGTIRHLTDVTQWRYIPSSENPADMLTRFQNTREIDLTRWINGPKFLQSHKCDWNDIDIDVNIANDDPEVKRESVKHVHVLAVHENWLDKLIEYYSSWFQLKRVVALIIRIKFALKHKTRLDLATTLTVKEMQEAEMSIVKYVQKKYYANEIKCLERGDSVNRSSAISALVPFLDDSGVLRVGGRVSRASLDYECKHPYLLPHESHVARLIVLEEHNVAHLGTEWIVSKLREKYWIIKVRRIVKSVSSSCFKCRKLNARPNIQMMADLPIERLTPNKPPFTFVGVDCFGPFKVKVGRCDVKRYGCIFTCLATRAVHLEKLDAMDSDSFINAMRRFIARRGVPSKIFSDNGTNFVGSRSEFYRDFKNFDDKVVDKFCLMHEIEWSFNPPSASHWGGIWERMIRTVRRVLVGITDFDCKLSDEMLHTLFCECESMVNGRPVTKLSDDVTDAGHLTPNHLLLLKENLTLPPGLFSDKDLYKKRWRCVQHLANCFWKRWIKCYIPELQQRNKWLSKQRNIKVGDLVLLQEENTPRGVWPMGLVVEATPSVDGLVRTVRVKTKVTELVRPISRVVLLEGSQ